MKDEIERLKTDVDFLNQFCKKTLKYSVSKRIILLLIFIPISYLAYYLSNLSMMPHLDKSEERLLAIPAVIAIFAALYTFFFCFLRSLFFLMIEKETY